MTDPLANVQRLVDDWERAAEQKAARYESMRQEVERISLTRSAAGGAVSVTVGPNGIPSEVSMTEAVSRLRPEQIAAAVMEAMRQAQAAYPAELARIVGETVGDTASGQHIVATAERNFPQVEADSPPVAPPHRPRRGDGDDFSDDSYLG
ncbi:YbaB/EbfC family nucleoid-associated protein [Saccharothrix luteola]|uniref:YbaB/EbfC family nucleoid-associated protein n=1 Tax=Saccharothrix luteola TaxID=2893018 RepID=UPI001E4A523F|nr:YbaB/EbfC family nucleoid-associated protein [Saccharothrix luteola]MCC8251286.1 YbaB/EbfC family nucleoid-associated protein [Saccharothrix luteola]